MSATLQALADSRDRIGALERELAAERERRRTLVVQLVDAQTPRKMVCAAGGVSPKTVCLFLADAPIAV